MNTRILILITFIFPFMAVAQPQADINKTDSQGRKQGYWKKLDEKGRVKYEGSFRDDKPEGVFKYYYPEDGSLKAVSHFSGKGSVSYTVTYHPNGKKMAEGKYIDAVKDSTWKYYNEAELLITEESFRKGVKHGVWRTYFPNGKPQEEYAFVSGKKQGKWTQFFDDGSVKLRCQYEDGLLQGIMQVYYTSGLIMATGNYKNSLKEGVWIYFDEFGKPAKKEYYSKSYKYKEEILSARLKEEMKTDSIKASEPPE